LRSVADGSYLVPCLLPSHGKGRGDRNPSLSLRDGKRGLLVYCHAGCDARDILDAIHKKGGYIDRAAPRQGSTIVEPWTPVDTQERQRRIAQADRIWRESYNISGTAGAAYLARRHIPLEDVPNFGGLRWHPRCPWESGGTAPCVLARFTDAITGEPHGIWRRPINGGKPKTLGPMGGCVIRLWPDEDVSCGLVLGEGVETTLAAATCFVHRNTLLRPAWAAGSAGNLENFPIIASIATLTLLVDHDESGRGQEAARGCGERWHAAGREVMLLTPRKLGTDFNDLVRP
jgi:Toprim domain-containing protein